jgi:hypothetical protein
MIGILLNKWTWIVVGLIAIVAYGYSLYNQNQELLLEIDKRKQNEAALYDEWTKSKDSVQTLTVRVGNLNKDSISSNDEYIALKTKYQIALTTIEILDRPADTIVVSGDSVTVPFSGKEGIASYVGSTTANIKTKTGVVSLKLSFSDIETTSELFLDETDNLWKIRTVSLSPGVKLRGLSTIDDDTFRKIRGTPESEDSSLRTLALGGSVNNEQLFAGIVVSPGNWSVIINYKLFDKRQIENELWYDKLQIGVYKYIW